jgi:hypothetical protein
VQRGPPSQNIGEGGTGGDPADPAMQQQVRTQVFDLVIDVPSVIR